MPDPAFRAGDQNRTGGYTYAADNPASGSDPTGFDGRPGSVAEQGSYVDCPRSCPGRARPLIASAMA